jgi:uncharacterized membrane protein
MDQQKISEFKQFMAEYWPEYLPQANDIENTLTYIYDDPGKQADCLLAFILFLLGIIPGVLYLVLGGTKPKKYIINVRFNKETRNFLFSGEQTNKIENSYKAYIQNRENFKIKKFKRNLNLEIIAVIIVILALLSIIGTLSS